jgi:hypothetical protein
LHKLFCVGVLTRRTLSKYKHEISLSKRISALNGANHMTPKFILHTNYLPREVEFVLSKASPRGWQFFGRDRNGYIVPALNPHGQPLCDGVKFATQAEAAFMARTLDLPAYAIWDGRTRRYKGEGAKFQAFPRNYEHAA